MIREEILPQALSIGIDYTLFWHLNITKIKPFYEAYRLSEKRKQEELEISAYIYGVYVKIGVASAMNKKNKFPDKPVRFFGENVNEEELSEKEIQRQREALIANLQIMQANFELEHNKI